MSWNGKQWTGNYWGQKKPKGKGKGQKSDTKDKNKEKGGDKVVFPTYDAMAVGPSQGSSSASASSGSEAVWQQALKSLIVSNPNLTVPKEVSEVLDESMTSDTKRDLYAQQRALNARRKASQRLERLQNALTRQKLQMQAYQEHMRQQLKTEMDRFRTEQKELEQKVEEAKTTLQKIEAGEEVSAMEEVNVDPVDVSLADMLGITPEADAMVQKARQEKEEAFAMVHQLQTQIHMIMQNGAAQSNLGNVGNRSNECHVTTTRRFDIFLRSDHLLKHQSDHFSGTRPRRLSRVVDGTRLQWIWRTWDDSILFCWLHAGE